MDPLPLNILVVTPDLVLGRALEAALRQKGIRALVLLPSLPVEPGEHAPSSTAVVDSRCEPGVIDRVTREADHVILAGERGNGADILKALRSGACDFLPRDFSTEELDSALSLALEHVEATSAVLETKENGETRQVKIHGRSFTIGRDATNDLCLDSIVVSRFHARIVRKGSQYAILDRGSRHGVFLNNHRVEEGPLSEGSQIRLGTAGAPILTFRSAQERSDARRRWPGSATASQPGTASQLRSGSAADSNQEMRDIAALVDTFLKLNGDLLLDDLLEIVVARSIELADAERGMILLTELCGHAAAPEKGEPGIDSAERPAGGVRPGDSTPTPNRAAPLLRLAIARNRDGTPISEEGLLMSRRIPGDVLGTGTGAILEDLLAPGHTSAHPGTIEIGVRSAMCVPLRVRRAGAAQGPPQVIGVLYVDSTTRARPFSPRLLHALESLASEAAQAIFNSRLYEESLQKREMDAEMHIARAIQKNLLPPSSYRNVWMELHGSSQASREVGGDLLDYYPFGEERVNLVVGDVSGKGIPAAIFSSMLDGLCYGIGAQAGGAADLGKAAGELNRYLVSKSGLEKFVSVVFGTLWADGRLAYVNAGHNPPLVIRGAGTVELLREHGMIMGMFDEAEYSASEVRLSRGEVLVLYSDGITEARARGGERFGVERLKAAARGAGGRSPKEIHDAILAETDSFTRSAPPGDDVTLMVVKYLGRS